MLGDDSITSIEVTRVGEHYGFESVVARVDARSGDGARRSAWKFCSAENARNERFAYERVLAPSSVRRPRFVAAHHDGERGIVVTSFATGRQGDVLAGCDDAVAADVVASISDLHGTWWERAGSELPDLPSLDEQLRRPLTGEQVERCVELHGDAIGERGRRILRDLPDRVDAVADELAEFPTTVVHADLHLDNVMIGSDGTATILDWGRPRRAPAVVDLARCFIEVTGARPDDRRGRELLRIHIDRLGAHGVEIDPSSVDRALELAVLAFAPGVVRWAASTGPQPGTRPWSLLRNALSRWSRLAPDQSRPA